LVAEKGEPKVLAFAEGCNFMLTGSHFFLICAAHK